MLAIALLAIAIVIVRMGVATLRSSSFAVSYTTTWKGASARRAGWICLAIGIPLLLIASANCALVARSWQIAFAKLEAIRQEKLRQQVEDRRHDERVRLYNRGLKLLYEQRNPSAAATQFSDALKLEPDPLTALQLMECRNQLGQFQRVIDDATRILIEYQGQVEEAYVYEDRGYAYYRLGRYDKALEDCASAIEKCPPGGTVTIAYGYQGWIRAACADAAYHHPALAQSTADNLMRGIRPNNWLAYDQAAAMYARAGNFYAAQSCLGESLKQAKLDEGLSEGQRVAVLTELGTRMELYRQDTAYQETEPRSGPIWRLAIVLF